MMMHAHGRGTIALINYQGDEAVDQINALLGAVVRCRAPPVRPC
jgi:hypothetical protein